MGITLLHCINNAKAISVHLRFQKLLFWRPLKRINSSGNIHNIKVRNEKIITNCLSKTFTN